jgi:hypothetical protein
MLMPLAQSDWQILRAAVRGGRKALTGRELRVTPTGRTRDGRFLTNLVERGLLKVVRPNTDPFAATYRLTPLGEHAAEFGEYDVEIVVKALQGSR